MEAKHPDLESDWQEYIGVGLAVIVGLVVLFFILSIGSSYLVRVLPDRFEKKLASAKLGSELPKDQDDQTAFKRAQSLFSMLLDFENKRDLAYRLGYLPDSSPNAAAIPGGTVLVTKGLLEMLKTEIGIAFVLGHELGHHQLRHAMKSFGTRFGFALIVGLTLGQTPFAQPFSLLELKYSRDAELAADAFAVRLVQQKFKRTDGVKEFFEQIKVKYPAGGIAPQILLTHPYPDERMQAIERLLSAKK